MRIVLLFLVMVFAVVILVAFYLYLRTLAKSKYPLELATLVGLLDEGSAEPRPWWKLLMFTRLDGRFRGRAVRLDLWNPGDGFKGGFEIALSASGSPFRITQKTSRFVRWFTPSRPVGDDSIDSELLFQFDRDDFPDWISSPDVRRRVRGLLLDRDFVYIEMGTHRIKTEASVKRLGGFDVTDPYKVGAVLEDLDSLARAWEVWMARNARRRGASQAVPNRG